MSQKAPVNDFKWINDTSQFNENFIKNYKKESDEEYFLEVDVQYLKKLHPFLNDLLFLLERLKNSKKFVANLHYETEYVIHIYTSIKSWISFKKSS